nr:MAG TPA: hypothetical protein [Caudoviricetes sp.]
MIFKAMRLAGSLSSQHGTTNAGSSTSKRLVTF